MLTSCPLRATGHAPALGWRRCISTAGADYLTGPWLSCTLTSSLLITPLKPSWAASETSSQPSPIYEVCADASPAKQLQELHRHPQLDQTMFEISLTSYPTRTQARSNDESSCASDRSA